MSVEQITSTENQQITNYDISKLLHGNNEFEEGSLTASGDVALVVGMVMARVAATSLLTPCVFDATDGSQYPVGIAIETETVLDGITATIVVANKGYISESMINFLGSETLASQVGPANNKRIVRDLIEDLGITLKVFTELTANDNQ